MRLQVVAIHNLKVADVAEIAGLVFVSRLTARANLSMGRTRPKTRKAHPPATELTETKREEKSEPTIEAILEKAQELVVQCDYDLAGKFVERVLQRAPNNVEGKEILGVVQLETGLLDAAKQVRMQSHTDAHSVFTPFY
jgi:hypothetical protein